LLNDKDYIISINGVDISVTEEQYRAIKRPVWAERKRRKVRAEHEWSLEAMMVEGFDIPDICPLVEIIIENKFVIEMLAVALSELTADERGLINSIYFDECSLREYARLIGSNHTKVIRQHKRILSKLKKYLKKYL